MILIIYSQSVIVVVILFYLGFLSRTFAIHRTSGEEGEFLYLGKILEKDQFLVMLQPV